VPDPDRSPTNSNGSVGESASSARLLPGMFAECDEAVVAPELPTTSAAVVRRRLSSLWRRRWLDSLH
jgi:hypothetical protein